MLAYLYLLVSSPGHDDLRRLDDVNASADLSQVQLVSFKKRTAVTMTLSKVTGEHGWVGSLDYQGCKRTLRDCLFDNKEEEVCLLHQTWQLESRRNLKCFKFISCQCLHVYQCTVLPLLLPQPEVGSKA